MKKIIIGILLAVILLLGLGFSWAATDYGWALAARHYSFYVAQNYMPAQRRQTGQWPADLSGLPRFIKADKEYGQGERLQRILEYHEEHFDSFSLESDNSKDCTFTMSLKSRSWFLRNFLPTCRSTVTADEAYCGF